MGGLRVDPKELPLPMREQVAVKIVAELAASAEEQAPPVEVSQRVKARKLLFPNKTAAERFRILRMFANAHLISDLRPQISKGKVWCFTYQGTGGNLFAEFSADWRGKTRIGEHHLVRSERSEKE